MFFAKPQPSSSVEAEDSSIGTLALTVYRYSIYQVEVAQSSSTAKPQQKCSSAASSKPAASVSKTVPKAIPEGKGWYQSSVQTVLGDSTKQLFPDNGQRSKLGELLASAQFKFTTEDALRLCGWDGVSDSFVQKKPAKTVIKECKPWQSEGYIKSYPPAKPNPTASEPAPCEGDDDDDEIEVIPVSPPTPTTLEVLPDGAFTVLNEGPPVKQAKANEDVVVLDD
eukprot:m.294233 g.294233  ORF g.294233 m.294233 type:complete len:224 (+) comp40370_c0_seq1:530-1201(+)